MSTEVCSKYRMRETARNTEAQVEYNFKIDLTEIGVNGGTLQWTLGFLNSRNFQRSMAAISSLRITLPHTVTLGWLVALIICVLVSVFYKK